MAYNYNDDKIVPYTMKQIATTALITVGCIGGIIGAYAAIQPKYSVWAAQMRGEAEYAQAEQNRRITVLESQAKLDAAKNLAAAEIERAKGVAQANEIIGESLKNNESYLRWLWIENLDKGNNSVIYVPTEAGLPILEAGKRPNGK
jgi:regulator of protease activity HflC (stomatin/prohibitin superfamily)